MNRTACTRQLPGGVLLACLLALAACTGFQGQAHRLQVTGTDRDGGELVLTVIGPADLVTGARSVSRLGGLSDEGVQLNAEGSGVMVWWPGAPCEDHPSIEVNGTSDTVSVEVDNGPTAVDVCSHNEVQFTVQLAFSKAFAAAEMDR